MHFDLAKFFKNQYLKEAKELPKDKWVSLSPSDLEAYKDDIFGLIQTAYSYIGGHSNYKSPDDITGAEADSDYEVINLDDDPAPEAVNVSKDKPAGTKFVATGHDGSSKAKREVITHKIESLKKQLTFWSHVIALGVQQLKVFLSHCQFNLCHFLIKFTRWNRLLWRCGFFTNFKMTLFKLLNSL